MDPLVLDPLVHPSMEASEVKRRTGFCSALDLIAYVLIFCNVDLLAGTALVRRTLTAGMNLAGTTSAAAETLRGTASAGTASVVGRRGQPWQ